MFIQIDPSILIKMNPLSFQEITLQNIAFTIGSGTDFALAVDDPLPGNITASWQGCHSEPDSACCAADESGDLPIGGDVPGWYLTYPIINGLIKRAVRRKGHFRFFLNVSIRLRIAYLEISCE